MATNLRQSGAVIEQLFVTAAQGGDMASLQQELRGIAERQGTPETSAACEQVIAAANEIATHPIGSMVRSASVENFFSSALTLLSASATH